MKSTETYEELLERERKARIAAEEALKEKQLELQNVKQGLIKLNTNLELEVSKRIDEIKRRETQRSVLFDKHPFPIMVYELSSLKILEVNNTAIEQYGFSQKEFQEKIVLDLHPSDEITKLKKHIKNIKKGIFNEEQWNHRTAHGEIFEVNITGNFLDYIGKKARLVIIEDVTEKNRLLKEKIDQERKYLEFIENSSDIIYRINESGNFIYVNLTALLITGYTKEELLKMNFADLVAEKYVKQVTSFYQFQMENKLESTYTEFPIVDKNGKQHWIGQNVEFATNETDPEVIFNATARDITERKKVEKKLLRSEEKFRSIIENMELGLLEVDTDNTIIKAYPKFCLLTGYDAKELEGKQADELLLDDEGRRIMEQQVKGRNKGDTNVYEIQVIKKDGSKIWVLISGAPFYDEYNRLSGSVGIHLDISAQKILESDLKAAKIKAEELLKSKELFLANISHEIRTPLNAIIGITQLMNESIHDPNLVTQLEHVNHAGKGLLSLINELLTLSKVDANKLVLNTSTENLYTVLKQNFDLLQIQASDKNFEYNFDVKIPKNNNYYFDSQRLGRVIQNLLSNAIKFTTKGEVKLFAEIYSSSHNSDIILFQITDTGIGIPQDSQDKIFENFEQADNNLTGDFGGTGLGLSIVKKILGLMNGEISVESKKGRTKFEFYLKLKRESKTNAKEDSIIQSNSQKDLSGVEILVAEDNEVNIFLIKSILNKLNAKVHIVDNGLKAVKFLESTTVDLVLMDMRMPVLDGIGATIQIRKELELSDLPIIALTANAGEKNKQICMDSGMNDFIPKPYTIDQLRQTIENNLPTRSEIKTENNELHARDEDIMDEEIQNKLNRIFVEDAEHRIVVIEQAIMENDYITIKDICHSMKPSLNHLGQDDLYQLSIKIENQDENIGEQSQEFLKKLITFVKELKKKIE